MRQRRQVVPGTKAAAQALRRRSAGRLSLLAGTLGLLVFLGGAQAASAIELGETGLTGPTGSGNGEATSVGVLAHGKQEMGGWSATISVPKGGPQTQADATITYPIPLGETVKAKYLNETQVGEASGGLLSECKGSATEPYAEAGWLCVYQGAVATPGSSATEWKNAGFSGLQDFSGSPIKPGKIGELVVFRTTEFEVPPGAPKELAATASLTAAGSWAVRVK